MGRLERDDRARGKEWFLSLDYNAKWELGDQFVLGSFDWRDWGFEKPPSRAFLDGADDARIYWEIMLGEPSPVL